MGQLTSKFNTREINGKDSHFMAAAIAATEKLQGAGVLSMDSATVSALISNESFSEAQVKAAQGTLEQLIESCESFSRQEKPLAKLDADRFRAMGYALASAMNPSQSLRRFADAQSFQSSGNPLDRYSAPAGGLDMSKMPASSLEAYDTKPNEDLMRLTAAYALAASQQNKFGELFFRTVNLSPDEYAISMEIPLIAVHDEVRYDLEVQLTDFKRRNVVNAEVDHTILKNNLLKITPVHRTQTADAFVDPALVAPTTVETERGPVRTAPLKVNSRQSLFRLAQTDAQIAKGQLDQTDALDPSSCHLDGFYVALTDGTTTEVVRFDARGMSLAQFMQAQQGATRLMQLNFVTDAAMIGADTKLHNQATSTLLTAFQGANAHTAWLSLSLRGDIDLRDSSYEIITGDVSVSTLKNAQGQILSPSDPANAALFEVFENAKVIGFDIDARFVNSNLRELGQLVDFNTFRMTYGVKLGSPLTVQRPITNGDSQDALHAAALSYLCKVRQSNEAVTALETEVGALRGFQKRNDYLARQPEFLGISAYLVEPTLQEMELDLPTLVTTTAQHQRYADVTAIMTDAVKITAYKMWQLSNWQSAANLLEGTEAELPEVAIGTSLDLAQYLYVEGDTRTVGPDFKYTKAMTPDMRVRDKIYIAFNYAGAQAGVPHPLNHGMMINKPEVVAALNLSRGSHSRELIVHPSFRHVWLTPILGLIHVKGLKEALTTKAVLGIELAAGVGTDNATPIITKDAV